MLRGVLAILLLALTPAYLYGQTSITSGYIVTHANDTLRGELKYKRIRSAIDFYANSKAEKQIFKPYQLKGFGFDEGQAFQSVLMRTVSGKEQQVFANVLVSGKATLLRHNGTYLVSFKDSTYHITRKTEIIEKNGRQYLKKNYAQLGAIHFLLSNCADTKELLSKNITVKELNDIILAYNICAGPPYTEHNNKKPWTKIDWGLSAGTAVSKISFRYDGISENMLTAADFKAVVLPNIGLNVVASSPRLDDRFAFQGGLIFEKASYGAVVKNVSSNTTYDIFAETSSILIPLTVKHTFYNSRLLNTYWRAGMITGTFLNKDLHWVKEVEYTRNGNKIIDTYKGSYNEAFKSQLGYIAAIGASRPIYRHLQGYLEVSYDKINPHSASPEFNMFRSSQLRIVFGILY